MFFIPTLFVEATQMYYTQHTKRHKKYRVLRMFLLHFLLINVCTFSISYARGVKALNFEQMTISYRLKYMGLGLVLGLMLLVFAQFGSNKTKKLSSHLTSKVRNSNFDLLKIIAIGLIVLFHYVYGKWDYSSMGNYKVIIDVIWMLGELGVNVFALISGYFMIEQERPFKAKKICLMWIQVIFYSILSTTVTVKMGVLEIDWGRTLQTIFPITYRIWWYASAYFCLYFLTPFINKGLKTLEKKEYIKLNLILLLAFSIWPTFIGIIHNDTESFLFYNRFIWILSLYCIAGYIRIYGLCREKCTLCHWLFIHICTWILTLLFIVFMPENGISNQIKMKNTYFWSPNSTVMVVLSISLFMIFCNLKMNENSVISYIASCVFGIYLGHAGRSGMIWSALFHKDLVGAKAVITDMVCAFTCTIMATLIIESIRKQMEKPIAWIYDIILRRCKSM